MVNLIAIIGSTLGGCLVVGLLGYFIWVKSRPVKKTWKAKIYTLSGGARVDKDGEYNIKDLKPYSQDLIEEIHRKKGTFYRLKKLKLIVDSVPVDLVEVWSSEHKEVSLLLQDGVCSYLKKGFDESNSEEKFEPMPYSRVNLIKGEIATRQERIDNKKDVLTALAPFVALALAFFFVIAVIYIGVNGQVESSANIKEANKLLADAINGLDLACDGVNSHVLGANTVVEINQSVGGSA